MANHADFSRAWRNLSATHERRNRRVAKQKIRDGKEALDYRLTGRDVI